MPIKLVMKYLSFLSFGLSLVFVWSSCVDLAFDAPPAEGEDVMLTPNATIAELRALHTIGQFEEVTQDWIIEAVVIADDRTGNFYRTLVVQDETGGIDLRINATDLYNDYPIGRKVYLRPKGLWLGDYNGQYQLGGGTTIDSDGDEVLAFIEPVLLDDYLVKGPRNQPITPRKRKITELSAADLSTLVQLDSVQFVETDAGQPYADAANRIAINRLVEDCDGNAIVLRTSGYADFASELTPQGNGSLTAVFSIFRDDLQLYIRDLDDVALSAARCETGSGSGSQISIQQIRNLFSNGTTVAPDGKYVRGIVISDRTHGNIHPQNLVLQDGDFGIVVRFTEAHPFALGETLEVDVSGLQLNEFNGLLQLNNVFLDRATSKGLGTLPAPRVATVADILANAENWESTLVKVENATLSGGAIFSGNRTLSDATGSIILYTRSAATFANEPLPTGTVHVTGILAQFNDYEITIRNLDDVEN